MVVKPNTLSESDLSSYCSCDHLWSHIQTISHLLITLWRDRMTLVARLKAALILGIWVWWQRLRRWKARWRGWRRCSWRGRRSWTDSWGQIDQSLEVRDTKIRAELDTLREALLVFQRFFHLFHIWKCHFSYHPRISKVWMLDYYWRHYHTV